MKVPDIFRPEKILENKIKQFLENQIPKKYDNNFGSLNIEFGVRDEFLHSFDASLALLKEGRYERHPYPWESFRTIIAYLENKLPENLNRLGEEMLQCGEWFSMAFERKKDNLICYLDPEGIRWDNNKGRYVTDLVLTYSGIKEFNVYGISSGRWADLKSFDDSFVEYFYTRKFEDLPERIKKEAKVLLPPDSFLCPIGSGRDEVLSISCIYDSFKASRGVLTIRK